MTPPLPITTALLAATLGAGDVTFVAGGSSFPEISLEGLEDEAHHAQEGESGVEESWEPAALFGIMASYRFEGDGDAWGALNAQGFGYLPESEVSQAQASFQGGLSTGTRDASWADVTGRVDIHAVPGISQASSGRAEVVGQGGADLGPGLGQVSLQIIGRRYPWGLERSFAAAALTSAYTLSPQSSRDFLTLSAGVQGNMGYRFDDDEWEPQPGAQLRLGLAGGHGFESSDIQAAYRLYWAVQGDGEEEEKAIFTPIGFYADDADALSSGGFVQHRLELSGRWYRGPWTLSAYGVGRLRLGEDDDDDGAYAWTWHAHSQGERRFRGPWSAVGLIGLSTLEVVGTGRSVDVYGWLGARRAF